MCMIHVQLPDASLCACVMSLMIGDPPLHSFGNNHPCQPPAWPHGRYHYRLLLLLAILLQTLVEIIIKLKWFIVVWCIYRKPWVFRKGETWPPGGSASPLYSRLLTTRRFGLGCWGSLLDIVFVLGGGWDGKNGMIDHLVLTQIAGTTAEPQ